MKIRKLDDTMTPLSPKNLAEWEKTKEEMHKNIEFSTSVKLLQHDAPLDAHICLVAEYDDIIIEKVIIQTLPGFYLGGNIYRPKDTTRKYPVILNPHGHWRNGRIETEVHGMLPTRFTNFALRGMVAFAYDMIGYHDTNQISHDGFIPEYENYNYGRFSLQLNNSIKAIDFVSALPYVDSERIGCTGCSGGGTQTFFLSAYDERIKASAPINQASASMQGGCVCENTAFLRNDYNNVDYTMMSAPRPLFVASSDGDWTVNSKEIEFPAIKKVYELYNAENNFEGFYRSAPHCYEKCTRERVYKFFCKTFGVEDKYDGEVDIDINIEDLVLNGKLTFGGAPDFEGKVKDEQELFEVVKKIITSNLEKLTPADKKDINNRVFALDREFYFDIPYTVDFKQEPSKKNRYRINPNPEMTFIVMDECPKNATPPDVKYYHGYNFADDAKRVNGIIKLFEKYPQAEFIASGKTAALCEIAQKVTGVRNLKLSSIDASEVVIPGIALIS